LTTDANIQCLPSTDTPSNGELCPRTFQGSSFTSFIALSHGFDTSLNDGLSKEVFPCEYVAARATMCPIFQCLVCLCEISLPNYQPIMHSKHSYTHNHASYVLIHPIILLYHAYMLHVQLSTVKFSLNFNSNSNCQIQFNVKLSNSKQFPISHVNSNLNFNVKLSNSTQFQLSNSRQSQLQ
jgi:hypothetical protein